MSRAALLPTPGDPFLLTYWINLYRARWSEHVDRLYICINRNDISNQLLEYFNQLAGDDICLLFKGQLEHGDALDALLDECTQDYVMLVEDDAFIFKGNEVDKAFRALESGEVDLVGSRRGCSTKWLIDNENQKWGLVDVLGDNGPNFWPNFLFTKRETLLATDRNFAAKTWQEGEIVPFINLPAPELTPADTFVWASMQLRNMGLRIGYVKQYHGLSEDLEHHQRGYNLFDGLCPWLHVGSLSSGYGGFLSDKPLPNYGNTEAEKGELERRISFWSLFLDYYISNKFTGLEYLVPDYERWIAQLILHYHLSLKQIGRRKAVYRELMSWI